MIFKRPISSSLLFLALGLVAPEYLLACSCGTTTLAQRFSISDHVFTAVVVDEYIEPSDDREPVRSLFAITESFKEFPQFGALVSHPDGNTCGIDIDVGVEYLFYVPDSGHIGLCSGIRATESAGPELQALRAFSSGANPDLSEPWYYLGGEAACLLGTSFVIREELHLVSSLQFRHRKADAENQETDELRINVSVFDIKPEGEHNSLVLVFADRIYSAPWITSRAMEQELPDGSKRTLRFADTFAFNGAEMRAILQEIGRVDSFSVRFDSEGFGLEVNAEVGTSNLGSGLSEFIGCTQSG